MINQVIMEMQTISNYDIREGRTEIDFPYRDRKLTIIHPFFGPSNYLDVGKQILEKNLMVPTGDQLAAFLHAAYLGPEEFQISKPIREIRDEMISAKRYLRIFSKNLWTFEGVYVAEDPEVKGLAEELDPKKLESILNDSMELDNGVRISGNGRIRFAPRDSYRFGEHTQESLAKDGFVIANYNINGAKQLAEVSKKFILEPKIRGVELGKDDKPVQSVSVLQVIYDYYGSRLGIDGLCIDGPSDFKRYFYINTSYAFGILSNLPEDTLNLR
mgnify:CR=1 FL=1